MLEREASPLVQEGKAQHVEDRQVEGDDHHHSAIAELYDTSPDFAAVMKWKEIYDLTEKSIDRCEDIANVMHGIVLKNT